LEAPFIARPFAYSLSFLGLAATCHAQGKFDQACQHAQAGVTFAEEYGNPLMAARAQGFLAHLSFRQGKLDEALRWLAQPSRIPLTMPMPTFHAALVGRAAILLGLGDAAARAEADELLQQLRANVERYRNNRFLIEVLALQAFSLDCTGDKQAALDLLERAVLLTIPGTTLRALADLDHLVGPLLAQVAARNGIRSQVALIRRAAAIFPGAVANSANGNSLSPHPGAAPAPVLHPDLLEPLTFREMDVLLLLQDRPSNKEIAHQLCIATETVKRHLTNIYLKLHVQSRRQALVRAREMGILPPK
jgi:LuxR family maltose regulon positive regulatory protein